MIQINCTNCKSLLQIDDAFAGGVCRCRHCGTIQTVPKRLKASTGNGDAGGNAGNGKASTKPLFQQKKSTAVIEGTGSGTGLDDLAGIVASSGLTSSRLQKSSPAAAPSAVAPRSAIGLQDRRIVIIVSSAAGVIALLLGVIVFMAVRDRAGGAANQSANGTPNPAVYPGDSGGANGQGVAPAEAGKNPTFLGHAIPEYSVSYVIDRGSSSNESNRFELVKAALVSSLKSLGPDRKFQIVFWGIGNDPPVTLPAEGMLAATPANVADVAKQLDEIYSTGVTQHDAALTKAFRAKSQAIVLVPMKSLVTDSAAFADAVLRKRADATVTAKFYCFSIENKDWARALRRIAQVTGGDYDDVSIQSVRSFGQ